MMCQIHPITEEEWQIVIMAEQYFFSVFLGVNMSVANPRLGSILSCNKRKDLSLSKWQSFVQPSFNGSGETADTNKAYKLYRS